MLFEFGNNWVYLFPDTGQKCLTAAGRSPPRNLLKHHLDQSLRLR